MIAWVVLVALVGLLFVLWRRFNLRRSSFWRVVLVAFGSGSLGTLGLYVAWSLQPPSHPPALLVMMSDVLLLFPLVALVGSNITVARLAPVLMALEMSVLILFILSVMRRAARVHPPSDGHE
jgi:hypothetical protein